MRVLLILTLSSLLAGGAMAQRGGGGHGGGGGVRGGGGGGGGGFHGGGGSMGGGFRGGGGGFVGNFGHGGFVGNYGFRGGYGYGGYYPYYGYGYGLGYWPGYYDSGYGYPYSYSSAYYPAYQTSPSVTVVYPSQGQPNYYSESARPVSHAYDEYGQEVNPPPAYSVGASASSAAASPIYLIAMKDGVIRAAASYWVNGQTLHYVTMEHVEKQAPLSEIDHSLSQQLNRERRVQFQLPQ